MIELTDILPIPLKETTDGINSDSQIFSADCNFEKGQKYLVIAPSGKGKSTLLHIIYGLRNDFEGAIHFDGKNITDMSSNEWADFRQTKMSIVFQDLRLFPNLTAFENIVLKSKLQSFKSEEDIKMMATKLGIDSLLNKKAATLSYGQRQRVAIIRALCQPFEYLLLDEPFSHLDAKNISIASELIRAELNAQKAGLIMVSLGEKYDFNYHKELIL
ncbi:MAG: ATP-binding cassette domain-containing protein [Bacteroidetes bacterium]|nr:ATP-binding cassette domain-containing protein [Bacteroidota bacterium]MDF1867719.1 ATP-binding cassette domain-containing protein [Saprospiraceae bacterium]